MPTVRFSRDKRGYEYVYLVHTPTRRGKPGRTRMLYWYRTPPGVRMGRQPFDPDVQQLIEQQNPGVTFDWDTIVNTPMPPPDMTEYWRERRRQEKAAKQERRAAEAAEVAEADEVPADGDGGSSRAAETQAAMPEADGETSVVDAAGSSSAEQDAASAERQAEAPMGTDAASGSKKRRRRRGGRRRRPDAAGQSGQAEAGPGGDGDTADSDPSDSGDSTSEGE